MATINELVTKFTFKGTISPLIVFNNTLSKSITKMGIGITAFQGIAVAIGFFAIKTSQANQSLINLSTNTGVSTGNIQALGYAAEQTGSSMQAVQSTIGNLTQKIADASMFGSDDFARLGISVRDTNGNLKKADTILNEVRASFNRLNFSNTQQQSFATRLGIDSSLIQLLNKSGTEIDALKTKAKSLWVLTVSQAQQMNKLNSSLSSVKFGFDAVRNSIAVALAPIIEKLANQFTNFLARNKDLITNGLKKFVDIVIILAQGLKRLAPILITVGAIIGGLAIVSLLLNPINLIIIAITGLLFIVDDLIVAFKGGNSVIRDFVKNLFGIDITPLLHKMVAEVKRFFNYIIDIGNNLKEALFNVFKGIFKSVVALWHGDLTGFIEGVKQIFKGLVGHISTIVYLKA